MSKRPRLIHLLLILLALAALACGAWWYTTTSDPVSGIEAPAGGARLSGNASSSPSVPADALLYFPNARLGSDQECGRVFPVHREISDTVNDSAVFELLKGPTDDEKKLGYGTAIPDGVAVRSITRRKAADGMVVVIDFDAGMKKAAGSCRVASIRAQIERTVQAVDPAVKTSVVISVDGDAATALQP